MFLNGKCELIKTMIRMYYNGEEVKSFVITNFHLIFEAHM